MDTKKVNTPLVSIIIPCYNQGQYIDDALSSIDGIADKHLYETIIINDGSTDEFTNKRLASLSDEGYHVIFQDNQGLAMARNNGISVSVGKYILPLDADNKLRPEYIYKGIDVLNSNEKISVVYGNAEYFGDTTEVFRPGAFNLQKLLLNNYIDACAIYRRELWEATGGYDKNMPGKGVEDWEIWLHASFKGFIFHYIDEVLYDYRVLSNSMIRQLNKNKIKNNANVEYLIAKHPYFYGAQYIDENIMQKFSRNPIGFIGLLILKKWFPARFSKMVVKGRLRKYI